MGKAVHQQDDFADLDGGRGGTLFADALAMLHQLGGANFVQLEFAKLAFKITPVNRAPHRQCRIGKTRRIFWVGFVSEVFFRPAPERQCISCFLTFFYFGS